MLDFPNTRELLGDDRTLDALVSHSLTEYNDNEITSIGNYAFNSQENLRSVYLPNITSIGKEAFTNCSSMVRVIIGLNGSAVVTVSGTTFLDGTGRAIIFVPDSLLSNYREANRWSKYAQRIFGISDLGKAEWNETEISDTEDEIIAHINAGTAADRYSPGQYVTIDLGDGGQVRHQIVGKRVRELADGTGYAQLEWIAMEALPATYDHRMNPMLEGSSGNYTVGTGAIGGIAESEMQTHLNEVIWPLYPEKWRNVIKECKTYSRIVNAAGSTVNNDLTTAKLRIPSIYEVGIAGLETTGPSYGLAFHNNDSRIRKYVGTSSAVGWWLRSASDANTWYYVNASGNNSGGSAQFAHALVPSFST